MAICAQRHRFFSERYARVRVLKNMINEAVSHRISEYKISGMGSGRQGGRPTTAGSFSFEVNHVLRGARELPGWQKPAGVISWTSNYFSESQRLVFELEQVDERRQVANCTFVGTDYH
jgi:hypothetical protein